MTSPIIRSPNRTHQKSSLPFLNSIPGLTSHAAPYNWQAEGSSPSGLTIFYINHNIMHT
jgi:hypothetical protein